MSITKIREGKFESNALYSGEREGFVLLNSELLICLFLDPWLLMSLTRSSITNAEKTEVFENQCSITES